jgi:hypothetical protein
LPRHMKCMMPNNGLDSYVKNPRFARLLNDGQPKRYGKRDMETGRLIGLIIGITSVIPGILLSVFCKQIGAAGARMGKAWCKNPFLRIFLVEKLYEGNRSQIFVLVAGIWLTVWGVIAFFLLPALIGTKP